MHRSVWVPSSLLTVAILAMLLVALPVWAAPASQRAAAAQEPTGSQAPLGVDNDGDGVETPDDCNDNDDQIYPGAPERCNGLDDDCDSLGDEDFPTLGDPCTVGVGECETAGFIECTLDELGVQCDATAGTPTAEICDGLDNDCNGSADFPGETTDADGDGSIACLDCNDFNAGNYPGNAEVCDGQDNDCDTVRDDGFPDADGDFIGDACDVCPNDPGGDPAPPAWDQGFETDASGWLDQDNGWSGEVLQVVTGTNGITSAAGGFHATFEQNDVNQTPGDYTGPFSRFDGYRAYWPGGFTARVDVYLDTTWTLGEGFDYAVAANGSDNAHQRDFIFHVTKDTSTGKLLVAASNNTNFDPREDLETIDNVEITTSDWYTLQHVFRDAAGILAVDLQVLDSSSTVLFTKTLSNAADTIGTEVGGNRYAWFTNIDIGGGIAVDNHQLILGTGDSDGDGVCDSDDVCPGGDDNVDGDGDGVAAFCDCDDADASNYPGNGEICDGQDNDCSATYVTSALSQNGWFSDDTRADGSGTQPMGTNLISDTLTDDPEATASGTALHDADITSQIQFVTAPGVVPAGTHPYAVHLQIAAGAGSGKSQISHRKDDGIGHAPGSVFGPGFSAEYSWMGDGTLSNTASLKFGIKTAEFASTGVSGRTGENAWDKVLIYEPGNLNGGTSDGLWHTEAIDYTTGTWWFFDRKAGASIIGTPMTLSAMSTSGVLVGGGPKTVADVYDLITAPGAHITSVQFGIGSGNPGGSVYVNQLETNFYRTGDVTTFGGPLSGADFPGETTDADGDLSLACADCDDADPDNYPGNTEVCDGADNDCNLLADFPGETTDADGDLSITCADCDDADPDNYPGNTEVCDGQDNDCDSLADFPGETTDADGDGSIACLDCNDFNAGNYPGNAEVCDGQDNDCDTVRDDGFPDADGDFIGDACDVCPNDPGGDPAPPAWDQGFETDASGWLDQDNGWSGEVLQVVTGTNGITSAAGGFHATFEQNDVNQTPGDYTGPFSRFDGYRAYWPGGFTARVDVYLDTTWTLGEGFDYAVAANGSDNAHQRDFIFHVTKDTSTGKLLVAASNNTNFDPREDLETIDNVEITTSDWYTLQHVFRDAAGILAVDLQVLDSSSTVLFTKTLSNAADTIGTEVGGNRYAWFTNIDIGGGIAVDNHQLIIGTGDSDGDGVCDSDDVCPGGDDNVDGDGDGVAAFCDCDDADASNYPGNGEICDGQDNDCSATYVTSALSQNGWFSDDTRADGSGTQPMGTNLISDTLTDDPEATASGTALHDADITSQIAFVTAPGTVPAGTHPYAVHLKIAAGAGSGKSQISHRKDDGIGHAPGSVFGPGFSAEYSWMGDGTLSNTASLKFGIKTAEFASTGVSGRTGENAWDKVLIYEPGNLNGGTSDGLWHTEAIDYTTGTWWFFDRKAGASIIGTPMTLSAMSTSAILVGGGPKTVADVYDLITAPGAHITSVQFGIGSGNPGGSVYVNQLETNFYRAGDVTTFGGPLSGADYPGELTDDDFDGALACADCDDADPGNFPGNTEVCDGQDNDCNLLADFPGETTDADFDFSIACLDCDDFDPARFPGNPEVCDGLDNDCDLVVPVVETDDDGDLQAECEGDCDDTEPLAFLGNPEVCGDGIDNNCDTIVDAGTRYVATTGSNAGNDCTVAGSPCLTISHAIGEACDGDTVSVGPGTFPENLAIDKPLTLACAQAGVPGTHISRIPLGPAETIIHGGGGETTINVSASAVAIDGCDITGGGPTFAGVQLYNASTDITAVGIVNNLIHGITADNPYSVYSFAYGIFGVTGSAGARHEISGLTVSSNRIFGIGSGAAVAGSGVYLFNVTGGSPGAGAGIVANAFGPLAPGDFAPEVGSGVIVLEGADDGGGVPIAPSSGVLVTGNTYAGTAAGAVLFADDSSFDEDHADFTANLVYLLDIGTLTTVNEIALAPYAKSDKPTGFPSSRLYTPTIQAAISFSDPFVNVDVTDGLFIESNISVDRAATIVGASEAGVIVAPAGEDDNINSAFGGATPQQGFIIRADDVTIKNLTIDGEANPLLTPGKNNYRNGIITDFTLPDLFDRARVEDVTVRNTYRRGIYFLSKFGDGPVAGKSVDNVITGCTVHGVELPQWCITVLESDTEISNNTLYDCAEGIGTNYIETALNAPVVTIRGNVVTAEFVGGNLSGLGEGSLIGGPAPADANTWDATAAPSGLGAVVQYAVGQVTVQNNDFLGAGTDAGLWLYHNEDPTKPVLVQDNRFDSTGSTRTLPGEGVAIFATDDGDLFGDEDGDSYAVVTGNTIQNHVVGIELHRNGTSPAGGRNVDVTIGGSPAESNSISGLAGSTGILVFENDAAANGGYKAVAEIDDNRTTISGHDIGIDVDGGSATITGNVIDSNDVGIKVRNDGTAVATENHITNNATDGLDNDTGSSVSALCNYWNVSTGPNTGGDTTEGIVDASTWLVAADFNEDGDGDLYTSCTSSGDCAPFNANVFPGAPQICDGLNNDCLDIAWPALAGLPSGSANEFDDDGDLYSDCGGDCDDTQSTINPGEAESCDGVDNDCDTLLNNAPADDDCQTGNVCQADFCDNTGACDFDASGTCGIAGTVYYNEQTLLVDDFDLTKPVENAVIDLSGDTVDSDLSDSNGLYEFLNVAGTVTLDASKAADANDLDALSSQDAAEIAKYSVGLISLSPRQLVAAEVSNNGSVTSFDASLVAQKTVNPFFVFPIATATGSDWAFFEVPQAFSPIAVDTVANDLAGVVYGDVTLNWTPVVLGPGAGPNAPARVDGTGERTYADLRLRTNPATLYLADARRSDDGSWEFVIGILGADGIFAVDLALDYDPTHVSIVSIEPRGLTEAMQLVSYDPGDGRAAVALYGTEPLAGHGEFLVIRAWLAPGTSAGFPFTLGVEANEGRIPMVWGLELEPVRDLPDTDAGSVTLPGANVQIGIR